MKETTGTGTLLRLALRLDRIRATVWVLALSIFTVASSASNFDVYGTPQQRAELAASVETSPALLALGGRAFDLTTVGGVTAYQMVAFTTTLIGLMSILLVVRHTRAEEESGRVELVGSAVVGRHAWLASSLLLAVGVNLAIALLVALGLIGIGLPVTGSLAFAAGCAACGIIFALIAGVAAQLTESARAATGIASAVLGLSYLLRAAGDAATATADNALSVLTWLSPIGWAELLRPYTDESWWVLLLFAAAGVALYAVMSVLAARRDIGAGVLPPRLGAPAASPALRSSTALAWRLQRGTLIGWALGFIVVGAAFGGVAQGMVTVAGQNPDVADLIRDFGGAGSNVDNFIAAIASLMGIVIGAYAVQATLRLRGEEAEHRLDMLLSTAVERLRWVGGHVTVAVLGTAVVLTAAGLAAGLAHGLRSGDVGGEVPRVLGATLAQAPAVWVLVGVCVLLFGLAPRYSIVGWGVLFVVLVIGQFGKILQLDQWVLNLSPFTHVPDLPAADFTATPLLVLVLVGAALTAVGMAGVHRRDIA
ncbi:MAG TPA: ABC transporter permease [Micromonosporaceae bacterium]|nr:ABC transporter permease [Micromonosporaceae bacterium]